ncbi:hypothetical protein Rhopal_002343-T1 [Rhodotorula paludigena]|uniref:C3H1-type domain-containing protein n=1 Tax=Rhodotorula paludigena TaxID=86838 RepID=A0AAV5GL20_9BASI|nr:hypothetical protein Rhopal_002343-T1 [Rhodotorula paludigena]
MDDDAAVLAEIARLTSAIEQRKAGNYTPPPYSSARGRGSRGRGRGGRGASFAPHRNATWVAPGRSGASTPAVADDSTPAPSTSTSRPVTPAVVPPPPGPNGYRNQTLVLNKPATADTAAEQSTSTASSTIASGRTTPVGTQTGAETPKPAPTVPPPAQREVVIDGVVFVADTRGNKLVRKPDSAPSDSNASAASTATPPSPSLSTPRRTSHLGTTYIRTKSGNLVSLAFARRRKELADARAAKGEELLGKRQCSRAHTCPYVHDSAKIAICPAFLRSSCPRTPSTCALSHTPNAHRSPHCVHFPSCTRGAACPYAHVVVSAHAPVCRDFVELGWCDRGDECDKRHVRECWRFAETGRCDVKGCREPHVLRRSHDGDHDAEKDDDEEEGEEEDGEFADAADEDETDDNDDDRPRKRRATSPAVGISGAAGRRMLEAAQKKRRRADAAAGGFGQQEDFVQLMVPLTDDEDEDEEGMSVDSDDLDSADEGEQAASEPAAPAAAPASVAAKGKVMEEDEIDYGLSDDDEEQQVTRLLRP